MYSVELGNIYFVVDPIDYILHCGLGSIFFVQCGLGNKYLILY